MKNFSLILLTCISLNIQAQIKKVIVEDYTGAWCGYCPDGAIILGDMVTNKAPNVIAIANHNADNLEVPDGIALDVGFAVTSYPNGTIDRYKFSDQAKVQMQRGLWDTKTDERLSNPAIASVSFNNLVFDVDTRVLDVDISIEFTASDPSSSPKTINLGLVEDSIEATVGVVGLEQHNYLSSIGGAILDPWYHNHSLREWINDAWGLGGIVPNSPVVGDVYTYHYTYTVPMGWDYHHIDLVAYVAHHGTGISDREILNAEIVKLYTPVDHTSVKDIESSINNIAIYPSPSVDVSNIQFNLDKKGTINMEVYDMQGNKVANPINTYFTAGTHTIQWDLKNDVGQKLNTGNYVVRLITETGFTTSKIQIQ